MSHHPRSQPKRLHKSGRLRSRHGRRPHQAETVERGQATPGQAMGENVRRRKDQTVKPARRRRVGSPPVAVARTYQWQRLRRHFRAHCEQSNLPCWRCGAPIDYHAGAYQPLAFEADHAQPVSSHPRLAYEWSNLRPSHSRCNLAARDEEQGVWVRPTW